MDQKKDDFYPDQDTYENIDSWFEDMYRRRLFLRKRQRNNKVNEEIKKSVEIVNMDESNNEGIIGLPKEVNKGIRRNRLALYKFDSSGYSEYDKLSNCNNYHGVFKFRNGFKSLFTDIR